jgi:intracellular multiplication protein IcmL
LTDIGVAFIGQRGLRYMAEKISAWPTVERAVSTILIKDSFAAARHHFASRAIFLLALVLAFSLAGGVALWVKPVEYRFVLTEDNGDVIDLEPLDVSNHDDEFIKKWTVDAVTRLYSFDFVNYRGQFQRAKRDLTFLGFEKFEQAMVDSGNFRAVLGNRFVTTAVPTGPAIVTKAGLDRGRWNWKVEFPMQIAYRAAPKGKGQPPRVTSQDLRMTVTIVRQPEHINRAGLGIRYILGQ